MARKIRAKEVLRPREASLSQNAAARSQHMSKHSVQAVLEAAEALGVGWADLEGRGDGEACEALFPEKAPRGPVHADPDRAHVHAELARDSVTLKLLHAEYADGCVSRGPMNPSGGCRPG